MAELLESGVEGDQLYLTDGLNSPELDVLQFAPQIFDCVTVIALAAESAGSTDTTDFDDNGDPTTATFEIFHFGDDGYEIVGYQEYAYDD